MVGTNLLTTIPLHRRGAVPLRGRRRCARAADAHRFYAWHIFGLTLIMAVLVAWHIFRVRRDGGIAVPAARTAPRPAPDHPLRAGRPRGAGDADRRCAAGRCSPCCCPPRSRRRSRMRRPRWLADARAPWFFLWVQQLLRYRRTRFWMGVFVPLAVLALLALLPVFFKAYARRAARPLAPARRPQGLVHPRPGRARLAPADRIGDQELKTETQ